MVENRQNTGSGTAGNSTAGNTGDVPMLRIPSAFVMMTPDNDNDGNHYPGTVGMKYGSTKADWLRLSYSEMKKLMDFCKENKTLFNQQLEKERKSMVVEDL